MARQAMRNSQLLLLVGVGLLSILMLVLFVSHSPSSNFSSSSSSSSSSSNDNNDKPFELNEEITAYINREVQRRLNENLGKVNLELAGFAGKVFPPTDYRNAAERKKILVTGGAGFVGSHLVDRLMAQGHEVTVVDNFFTGRKQNIEHWIGHPNFQLINHDVQEPLFLQVDQIYHLASPASPPHYQFNPIKTIKTNAMGTLNMLGLARRVKAEFLLASTSEVYGDPEIHPQPETYWGHVNPIGPRACYDEGKRVSETMAVAYAQQEKVKIHIARIFNTFGPRMHPNDGRVVSNFIIQALQGKPITIYGEGKQTRSFQFVSDLVNGLMKLMNSNVSVPVNLGNPDEYSIEDFATFIQTEVGSDTAIIHLPFSTDDPQRRKPDITRARELIGWEPVVPVREGIRQTIEYFRAELGLTESPLGNVIYNSRGDTEDSDYNRNQRNNHQNNNSNSNNSNSNNNSNNNGETDKTSNTNNNKINQVNKNIPSNGEKNNI